ncbi:MAG: hypothetical protein NUV77_06935 [Thermoguttaceae bacterium]|jgi:hypothetical protein|nr:hypothetical protein [Thermoguttaceae bacterium]
MKLVLALVAALVLCLPGMAEAKRYTAIKDGKEVIVHTNAAPVVVHRVLPPYGLGKHVYAGRPR